MSLSTLSLLLGLLATGAADDQPAAVVSHIKVLSDRVPDVSSLDAWTKSFLKEGMSDEDKALAAWRTTVMFQHQDAPPLEYLHNEDTVQDPIKVFNVYGYSFCSVASCDIATLARHAGLKVRGWAINGHSVPEVYWDGGWHMLDASLINYFPKPDGTIASVEEILAAVKEWYDAHPGYKGDVKKLTAFQQTAGWTGWQKGPPLLARCPFYDAGGFWPARGHGWASTMQEYDGSYGKKAKPFLYEYGYSQGYQVNVQLRSGERLTRQWGNKGLHVNKDGGPPACATQEVGTDPLAYAAKFGDLAPGRLGNGLLEYEVPVATPAYRHAALSTENLDERSLRVTDGNRAGTFVLRMPSSYVYLTGNLRLDATIAPHGFLSVAFSDNNGLDWQEIASVTSSGRQHIDLSPRVLRRYDYRLRFELHGKGTAIDGLRLVHDIQHSQRPLPALAAGRNPIRFSAGPAEGTITIEGATKLASKGKQLVYSDFHPQITGFEPNLFIGPAATGSIAFPIETPGDIVRLRFGAHYRARDQRDALDYEVSFDGGQSWRTVGQAAGPTPGDCKYVVVGDVPPRSRVALVRYAGTRRNTTGILNFRIDADYREPHGGFRPVKVTYAWEEDGKPREDVHVARSAEESYTITCARRPVMKSIALELAE